MHYCGIDIAKRKHVVAVLDEKGEIVKAPFSVDNSHAGFEQLRDALSAIPGQVTVGLEATGHYWLALYEYLTRLPYPVVVFNPLQIHAYRKSGLRKVKNDRSDAIWIADFVRIGNRQPTTQAMPQLLQLKELARFRMHLTQQIGDLKRKVLGVLDRIFPDPALDRRARVRNSLFIGVFDLLATAACPSCDAPGYCRIRPRGTR